MKKPKQLALFETKITTAFGGSLNQGKRKQARPLDSKRPVHLILKAGREDLLLAHRNQVTVTISKNAGKLGVRICSMAVNADHLHLLIEFPNRELDSRWIRGVTGVLARKVPGLKWKLLPYTEVINWGRHLARVHRYVEGNRREAEFILEQHRYVAGIRQGVGAT